MQHVPALALQSVSLACALEFVFKFEYDAGFRGLGAKHEICWVCVGTTMRARQSQRDRKLEWQRLRNEFGDSLRLAASESR